MLSQDSLPPRCLLPTFAKIHDSDTKRERVPGPSGATWPVVAAVRYTWCFPVNLHLEHLGLLLVGRDVCQRPRPVLHGDEVITFIHFQDLPSVL